MTEIWVCVLPRLPSSARVGQACCEMSSASSRKKAAKADIPDIHGESVEELREAFDLFDTKGAGEILMSELVESMQTLGFQDKNPMMFQAMQDISHKRNGGMTTFIQFAEDLADLIRDVDQEKDLRMVFNKLDTENTGRISLENLKKVANEFGDTISDAELMEMMETAKYVDCEGLGDADEQLTNEVSFPDFYDMMTRGRSAAASNAAVSPDIPGRRTATTRSSFADDGEG